MKTVRVTNIFKRNLCALKAGNILSVLFVSPDQIKKGLKLLRFFQWKAYVSNWFEKMFTWRKSDESCASERPVI